MHVVFDNINNYDYKFYKNNLKKFKEYDKKRINKMINKNSKHLYILSRVLLIDLLLKKHSIKYNEKQLKFNKNNKPYINNIYFNISHSHDYAVVCTSYKKIGIDIEKIRIVDINIINYFCTLREKKYILNSINKYKSLFEIYCLKEAYFKMKGTGISNFKNIEFTITNEKIKCNKPNLNISIDYSINNYIIAIIESL